MKRIASILVFAVLAGCSGGTSYKHEGTDEGTTGRGDYVSDGARKIETREYDEAIRLLTVAINLDPRRDDAYYHRAIAKQLRGNIDASIEDFGEAVRVNTHNARAWFKRGWMHHHHKGDYQAALRDYNRAIEEQKDYADAYYHRGVTYQSLKVFESAVADIEKALRVRPVGWSFETEAFNALAICKAQNRQAGANSDPKPVNPK